MRTSVRIAVDMGDVAVLLSLVDANNNGCNVLRN